MKALLLFALLAAEAQALPEWLSLGGGLQAGAGPSQFTGAKHPAAPGGGGLFGGNPTMERRASLAGLAGLRVHAGWRGILEIQAELSAIQEGSKSVTDLGSGIITEDEFRRSALEWPLLLRLGWPIELAKVSLRPYVSGGYWGNHLWEARKISSVQGGMAPKEFEWKGAPMDDWGWCYGVGMETRIKGLSVVRSLGLEARYKEGSQDLDPKGGFEQKARSLNIIFFIGY